MGKIMANNGSAPKIEVGEVIWSYGHKSYDDAMESAWDDMSEGQLSACDRPRPAMYINRDGVRRWAVAIQDGGFQ